MVNKGKLVKSKLLVCVCVFVMVYNCCKCVYCVEVIKGKLVELDAVMMVLLDVAAEN